MNQDEHTSLPPLFRPEETAGPLEPFLPPGYTRAESRVAGIEVYAPIQADDNRPGVMDFKCPNCAATIGYSVTQAGLSCEYCGYNEAIDAQRLGKAAEQFEFRVDTLERAQKDWGEERKEMACQRCGGVVSIPPDTIAYTCPFCASNKVIVRENSAEVLRPRYLIPFRVNPQECRSITQKWLGSSWMIPGRLRESAQENRQTLDRFHPLYIPYWTFDSQALATWKAMVAHEEREYYYVNGERKERVVIKWRQESGKVQKDFNDLLVPGTTRLNLTALSQIDTYDIKELVLYEPRYLAGMKAQAYDLPLDEAWEAGRRIMREQTRRACLDRASSSNVRNFSMTLDFRDEAWRYILAPVYTSVYRYQENTYQIMVNGQTGRIAGPRPVDWRKFWLVILAILSPGLLLSFGGLLFRAGTASQGITLIGAFLLVVGLVVGFFLLQQAERMEHV